MGWLVGEGSVKFFFFDHHIWWKMGCVKIHVETTTYMDRIHDFSVKLHHYY